MAMNNVSIMLPESDRTSASMLISQLFFCGTIVSWGDGVSEEESALESIEVRSDERSSS